MQTVEAERKAPADNFSMAPLRIGAKCAAEAVKWNWPVIVVPQRIHSSSPLLAMFGAILLVYRLPSAMLRAGECPPPMRCGREFSSHANLKSHRYRSSFSGPLSITTLRKEYSQQQQPVHHLLLLLLGDGSYSSPP
ncbi:hypothetical protein niasHT_030811 [Heterodera trifolii]|uniref:C2H2-type domain-containing protein n=1 Tax=Heterodera trifolii TaxID=157864 RepID=A0ABD2HUW8_9BILA